MKSKIFFKTIIISYLVFSLILSLNNHKISAQMPDQSPLYGSNLVLSTYPYYIYGLNPLLSTYPYLFPGSHLLHSIFPYQSSPILFFAQYDPSIDTRRPATSTPILNLPEENKWEKRNYENLTAVNSFESFSGSNLSHPDLNVLKSISLIRNNPQITETNNFYAKYDDTGRIISFIGFDQGGELIRADINSIGGFTYYGSEIRFSYKGIDEAVLSVLASHNTFSFSISSLSDSSLIIHFSITDLEPEVTSMLGKSFQMEINYKDGVAEECVTAEGTLYQILKSSSTSLSSLFSQVSSPMIISALDETFVAALSEELSYHTVKPRHRASGFSNWEPMQPPIGCDMLGDIAGKAVETITGSEDAGDLVDAIVTFFCWLFCWIFD